MNLQDMTHKHLAVTTAVVFANIHLHNTVRQRRFLEQHAALQASWRQRNRAHLEYMQICEQ